MEASTRKLWLARQTAERGITFEDEIRPGAHYEVAVEHEGQIWVSGQIPRVQGRIVVTGRVGEDVSLDQARHAAEVSTLRALAILQARLGCLSRVARVLRMTVYVQSSAGFTQQSEVADAASALLYGAFAPSGGHTRTSVGVYQLPKNAAVELDFVFALAR
ncbi:RidA family protein [Aquabacterium sp. A7-Y]|uniref:RidA family protein n=1 Tax=Aquabacterium sp. A7-Y TaxID=1349605 RepID=UPI00223D7176|nr:RidA family protein [Aquabacterium sp. A7-Y]MCW7538364.1 RidA family protein [Aquabacterium sp. A7-Y]